MGQAAAAAISAQASEWGTRAIHQSHHLAEKMGQILEDNCAEIAFVLSTIALALFATCSLFFGIILGAALHHIVIPQPRLEPNESILSSFHVTLTIVGATAALIRLTPAGASRGLLFRAIPFFGSLAVGSAIYRTISFLRARF